MKKSAKKRLLKNCTDALLSVAPNYYSYATPMDNIESCERVFAYEFYHQLRCMFKDMSWYVHGEFKKGLSPLSVNYDKDLVYPDLVLHLPESLTSNLCAFEIKSSSPRKSTTGDDVLSDLKKLEMFTRPSNYNGLNFEAGVLILINRDFEEIFQKSNNDTKNQIKHYLETYHRIAIWNIGEPISNKTGKQICVDASCLKKFWKGVSHYDKV